MDSDPRDWGKEVHVLERYFIKPGTVDCIRSAFLGTAIDKYVTWLSQHAYTPSSVHRRVPVLMQFGECAHRRGAVGIPALSSEIEPFIKRLLRRRLRRPCDSKSARHLYIRHHGSVIEQFLLYSAAKMHHDTRSTFRSGHQ